ncbi:formate dehydrogenase subunit gamma [uncultured Paracoccus sp.]|uniref:formate dehydrogenase subunit gamma n=1 Tax=uncultured Paracoccus sp. TaxID=189685 RepID=UPI00261A79FC|nr:formate dehydrogenase subunit gamma [uncultured Paracoccus sp.]
MRPPALLRRIAAAAGLAVLLVLPAAAQQVQVNEGDFGRDVQDPTLMEPIEPPSSTVRLDPPREIIPAPAPLPRDEWQVTRMAGPSADTGSSSVRVDDPADAGMVADSFADVMSRELPAQESGLQLLGQLMRGDAQSTPPVTQAADPALAPSAANPEATVGALSIGGAHNDAEIWSAIREGRAAIDTQVRGPATATLIQDAGMPWLTFRHGAMLQWGGWLLLGTLAALALFFLIRGRIRIEGHATGRLIERFAFIERFGHWLTAGSFILLAITGLLVLFGRVALIPLFGHQIYSPIATVSKWVHNNVSWAFMLGLVMIFVMWVAQNIPNMTDLRWLAKGGGLFSKGTHVHAWKFNAGQKMVFWSVIILGASISVSGLSLMFPFDFHLFSHTFGFINGMLGTSLPETMAPQHEMQLAQTWHAIVAFLYIAIIFCHIYIGTIGMQGAFDAMGSGDVEVQWAREHHDLWYEEVTGRSAHEHIPPPQGQATTRHS